MATYDDCVAEIQQASGNLITPTEAKNLLERIHQRARSRKFTDASINAEADLFQMAKDEASALKFQALQEKRAAALNVLATRKVLDAVDPAKWASPADGLAAYDVGSERLRSGARSSVWAQRQAIFKGSVGGLLNQLDREGLLPLFVSGKLDRDIAREMWRMGRTPEELATMPASTSPKEAGRMAQLIRDTQLQLVQRANRAGAYINDLPGYISRQSHDMTKVRRAAGAIGLRNTEQSFRAWRDFILPLLDQEKTFADADPDSYLRRAWEGIVSGVHLKSPMDAATADAPQAGLNLGRNLADKASAQRKLHFKDADAWMDYNERFGGRGMMESIFGGFENLSRTISLMENYGTNPEHVRAQVIDQLKKGNRANFKMIDSLNSERLQNYFGQVTGMNNVPGNVTAARIASGIRAWIGMSKLGGSTLSSIPDIATSAAELRYQGVPLLKAYQGMMEGLTKGRGNAERREMARLLGVGFEGMLGEIHARFDSGDMIPGKISKLQQAFYKVNGLSLWTDTNKTSVALMMSNHLAEMAGSTFDKLDSHTQSILGMYNIEGRRWDLIRSTAFESENGYRYLTPDKVRQIPREQIEALLTAEGAKPTARTIEQTYDQLETQLRSYFIDRTDYAIPTPGDREQAILNFGTRPGTVLGEATRFLTQFKSFPLTTLLKGIGRETYGRGADTMMQAMLNKNGELLGLAHFIAASTVAGYFAMSAKDLFKGKTPRDPADASTWGAAMTQGGGLGIYGDFIFGEYNRFGQSPLSTLTGPAVGTAENILKLYSKARDGEDFGANLLQLTKDNTPFVNLFYTRAALDYLIFYNLQEMVNPGYLRRMEKRAAENGQSFIIPPSQ